MNEIPQFGAIDPRNDYTLRLGGYALIVNETDELAIVETPRGMFLPGGGCERNESPAEAVMRETREETGIEIAVESELGTADEYLFSTEEQAHYRKRCTFFVARLRPTQECSPQSAEADHVLKWISVQAVREQLSHESQRWALTQWMSTPPNAATIPGDPSVQDAPDTSAEMSDRQTYNLVTDTVFGPNIRLRDNLIQLISIVVACGIGVGVGTLLATPDRMIGAILGGIFGMVVGLFASGIGIMVYRAIQHARGKHD